MAKSESSSHNDLYSVFELITCEPVGDSNIAVFARERDTGDRVRIDVTDFEPYFYVSEEEVDKAYRLKEQQEREVSQKIFEEDVIFSELSSEQEEILEESFKQNSDLKPEIVGINEGYESIDDVPIAKITLDKPKHIRNVRSEFEQTWESDINYTMRFRIDTDIKSVFRIPRTMLIEQSINHYETSWTVIEALEDETPELDPRNFYFDIEVGGEDQKLPEDDDLNPIACITAFDNYEEVLYTWVWRDDLDVEEYQDMYYHDDIDVMKSWEIRQYDNETKMLMNFFEFYKGDFDVLSGWYSDKYDVPYVCQRAEELGIDPDVWSELGHVNDGLPIDSWGQAKIAGTFMNDLERRYDNIVSPQSSALDYVAKDEVGMEWEQESTNIQQIWDNDLDKLLEYNAHDVIATWLVDESSGITDFFFEKMYMTGTRVEDIEKDSNVITYYHLFESDKDEIIPKAEISTHKKFGGGRVIMPDRQGIVVPVAVLDLSKIYPSIMITLNMSYENAKGVDPIILKDSVVIEDEVPFANENEERYTITGKNYNDDGEIKSFDIRWELEPGHIVSPLEFGKDGRKEIWDKLYSMQTDGTLKKTKDWEFIPPEKQVTVEEFFDHEFDSIEFGEDTPFTKEEIVKKVDDSIALQKSPSDISVPGTSKTFDELLDGYVLIDNLPDDHRVDKEKEGTRLPNGVRIDLEYDGLTTRCLKKMFELRYFFEDQADQLDPEDPNYKDKYDRLMQKRQNMKDQINAVFGYLGYKKSPLFRPEIAMTTTFVGRNILDMCKEVAEEELGHTVVYGDTDSIMVKLEGDRFDPKENLEECVYESHRLGEYINARMDDFAVNFCGLDEDEDHMFALEFEKLYSRMFLGSQKKRYAGLKTVAE